MTGPTRGCTRRLPEGIEHGWANESVFSAAIALPGNVIDVRIWLEERFLVMIRFERAQWC
jgi:hypothetical protein